MELKNTTRELHEACTSFNSRIDQAEERISEVEDQLNEIKREGKMTEKSVYLNVTKRDESKLENTLQDIIQENFPNLARQANIQVQEIQRTPQRYFPRRATPRHIIVRFTRVEMKEKMLRAAREKVRLSFISEGKIKFFVDKQVLRDYITTRPALQELLKEALHMDGNNQYQPFQKHTKRLKPSPVSQTIALFIYLAGRLNDEGPFLILCPLSVLSNWKEEMQRFAPGLSCVTYAGDKEERAHLQQDLTQDSRFHVLLTTYEICLKDASFLKSFPWSVLVVDEAHRLKNQSSLLHKTLSEFSVVFSLLLTGTPIQNSLQELYSLLSFVEPDLFSKEEVGDFVRRYQDIEKESESGKFLSYQLSPRSLGTETILMHNASELHKLLQPFLLRRVKAEVATELPKKTEVVIYHGMSALQKKYYKAILMKDLDAFEKETAKKVQLQNVLAQLRKCVGHPYLFDGVEPEPFEVGDHLIEASGKLHLLDKLLAFLYSRGHRVLLFSQMTQMLDVLQDYMDYRGYSYERVDGSVRGEERYLAIKNFGQQPIFVFLLSTRAGRLHRH
ncbi:Chromodomain-helicase-DNA-binding protein 1-like [Plecturocebus cupreus]